MRTHPMKHGRYVGALSSTVIILVGALAFPSAARAQGSPPSTPALVSPANGESAAPGSLMRVRADDPDDADLQVDFHAAPRSGISPGTDADSFTFLVIPDTQNYVLTTGNTPALNTQLQWIVEQREELGLAFAAGLGDIVDNRISDAQWGRASSAMAILDNARVPHLVVPGNHDFDLATGDFAKYDQYFPVSRHRDAAWNSASATYGGFYGQNQFGLDASDRKNMNSYALFTAGGMQFLTIGLELNPPDDVIAWAQRVLNAYPDRRVIVVTHSYVNVSGTLSTQQLRTDVSGNSGSAIWQKLIRSNCSIFLVVNGHFTDGIDGEANRTDQNDCGRPVHGALSDYQGRPSGGDGWLRYYTFSPATDSIRATTFSPTLNMFETDADSAFTLAYEMEDSAELPLVARQTVSSGEVASAPLPDAAPGTVIDWYATISDGTTTTRGPTWTATVQQAPPAAVAQDNFSRTVAAGWGSAQTGGAWSVNSASKLTVSGDAGRAAVNAGSTLTATLPVVDTSSVEAFAVATVDRLPNQALSLTVSPRQVGNNAYGARIRLNPDGTLALHAMRDATAIAGATVPGLRVGPTSKLKVRVQVEGTNPTAIRARVWLDGATEPSTWTVAATDASANLQQPGGLRLSNYLSSSATNGPVIVTWDDVSLSQIGSTPAPQNLPPVASFMWAAGGLTVTTDAAASNDPDGVIASRVWSFDGVSKSGTSVTHSFPAPGTYPVALTVTDDDGASSTTAQSVNVTAPAQSTVARDTFERSVTAGWGNADTGGSWTVNSGAKLTVSAGVGRVSANAGSTLEATLPLVASTALDATVRLSLDRVPNQYMLATLSPRVVGTASYGGRLRISPNGSLTLQTMRGSTALAGGVVSGVTFEAGVPLNLRVQVQGTSPTVVRAKVWRQGSVEPSAWHAVASDSAAGLQTAGGLRVSTYLSPSTTNGPVIVTYDELSATLIP